MLRLALSHEQHQQQAAGLTGRFRQLDFEGRAKQEVTLLHSRLLKLAAAFKDEDEARLHFVFDVLECLFVRQEIGFNVEIVLPQLFCQC